MKKCLLVSFLAGVVSLQGAETHAILRERLQSAQDSSIQGVDGWRFLPAEIQHLLSDDPSKDPKNPLEAIVDFNDQLKRLGIRLIVVPVPAKAAIHPDLLDPRFKGENIVSPEASFSQTLRSRGVEILDLTPEFSSAKSQGPLYCARDTHWNGRAIALAAQKLREMLKDTVPKSLTLEATEQAVEIQGDLGGEKEQVSLRFIHPQNTSGRLEPDRSSPILVFGDSHALVFHEGGDMHAAGAGLPDQLAFQLQAPVDVLAVRGSGATSARISLARRARANPNYLPGKKVIIWCFGARELTQADAWKIIPLTKSDQPAK
ncbi:MAG TPA: hypothetical protein VIS99_05985 [Terrimicrobiaceae bacterium]